MRPMLRALLALSLSVAGACACSTVHVTLPPAPARTASLVDRDAYYEAHKPLGIAGEPSAVAGGGGFSASRFPALQLADGTRVSDPLDLAPAVGLDAPSMGNASHARDLQLLSQSLEAVGILGLSGGLASVLLTPLALAGGGGGDPASVAAFLLGGLVATLAGTAAVSFGEDLAQEAAGEKMTAFFLFERDLRARLALKRPDEVVPLDKKWALPGGNAPPPAVVPLRPPPEEMVDPAAQ